MLFKAEGDYNLQVYRRGLQGDRVPYITNRTRVEASFAINSCFFVKNTEFDLSI